MSKVANNSRVILAEHMDSVNKNDDFRKHRKIAGLS